MIVNRLLIKPFLCKLSWQFTTRKDYYKILGITNSATEDDIKEAYRKQAMKYHPDVSTTGTVHTPNAEKFRDIAEAYGVLSQPESKLAYDLLDKN